MGTGRRPVPACRRGRGSRRDLDWRDIRTRDRSRAFLWLPVVFGIGILTYFALPREPSLVALVAVLAACALATWFLRHSATALRILYAETSGLRIETAYPEVRRPFMPPVRGN